MDMGDRTQAEALRLAKAHLENIHLEDAGWNYSARDIGIKAREILIGLKEG